MANSLFSRALSAVATFSDKNVAVMPEQPSCEMIGYLAQITGEDADKLKRLYELFLTHGRLDSYKQEIPPTAGFAED